MTSPSFPAALDALANPGPTTETDDAGYELDIVIARLQNCVMAIEGKLGIVTGGPPATPSVLRRTATGSSTWQQVQSVDLASAVATRMTYAAIPTLNGSGAAVAVLGTVTTADWQGTGDSFLIASTAIAGPTVGGAFTLYYAVDGGADNVMLGPWNVLVANSAWPVTVVVPLVGLSAATHTHRLRLGYGGAGAWSAYSGYMAVVELRK